MLIGQHDIVKRERATGCVPDKHLHILGVRRHHEAQLPLLIVGREVVRGDGVADLIEAAVIELVADAGARTATGNPAPGRIDVGAAGLEQTHVRAAPAAGRNRDGPTAGVRRAVVDRGKRAPGHPRRNIAVFETGIDQQIGAGSTCRFVVAGAVVGRVLCFRNWRDRGNRRHGRSRRGRRRISRRIAGHIKNEALIGLEGMTDTVVLHFDQHVNLAAHGISRNRQRSIRRRRGADGNRVVGIRVVAGITVVIPRIGQCVAIRIGGRHTECHPLTGCHLASRSALSAHHRCMVGLVVAAMQCPVHPGAKVALQVGNPAPEAFTPVAIIIGIGPELHAHRTHASAPATPGRVFIGAQTVIEHMKKGQRITFRVRVVISLTETAVARHIAAIPRRLHFIGVVVRVHRVGILATGHAHIPARMHAIAQIGKQPRLHHRLHDLQVREIVLQPFRVLPGQAEGWRAIGERMFLLNHRVDPCLADRVIELAL